MESIPALQMKEATMIPAIASMRFRPVSLVRNRETRTTPVARTSDRLSVAAARMVADPVRRPILRL